MQFFTIFAVCSALVAPSVLAGPIGGYRVPIKKPHAHGIDEPLFINTTTVVVEAASVTPSPLLFIPSSADTLSQSFSSIPSTTAGETSETTIATGVPVTTTISVPTTDVPSASSGDAVATLIPTTSFIETSITCSLEVVTVTATVMATSTSVVTVTSVVVIGPTFQETTTAIPTCTIISSSTVTNSTSDAVVHPSCTGSTSDAIVAPSTAEIPPPESVITGCLPVEPLAPVSSAPQEPTISSSSEVLVSTSTQPAPVVTPTPTGRGVYTTVTVRE